jgi:hypothetical protein
MLILLYLSIQHYIHSNTLRSEKLRVKNNANLKEIILLELKAKLISCNSVTPSCTRMTLVPKHGLQLYIAWHKARISRCLFQIWKYQLKSISAPCSKALLVITGHFQKGKLLKNKFIVNL